VVDDDENMYTIGASNDLIVPYFFAQLRLPIYPLSPN
jgi:hypothetical protein